MDMGAIISRLAMLDAMLNGPVPVESKIGLDFGFARSPGEAGHYEVDSREARTIVRAVAHGTTPIGQLNYGAIALLNFFYPADDFRHDKQLDYYRQREWRIACAFAVEGKNILHSPTPAEREAFLRIDADFYGRELRTDTGSASAIDRALVHPGIGGRKIIEMVRRFVVPSAAVTRVREILSPVTNSVEVIAIDTF